jgi:hypothetical protein
VDIGKILGCKAFCLRLYFASSTNIIAFSLGSSSLIINVHRAARSIVQKGPRLHKRPVSLLTRLTIRKSALLLTLAWTMLGVTMICLHAQEARRSNSSPFDTILNTKIWPDMPEAKDFVKQSRPADDSSLEFQPMTRPGSDPARPKPRSGSELEALKAELEKAEKTNKKKAGRSLPSKSKEHKV